MTATKTDLPAARVAARKRNVESKTRAMKEKRMSAKRDEYVIYSLKNRATGEIRVLVDCRNSRAVDPWVVRNPETGVEVGFPTRKALGAGYAHAKLS